MQELKQKISQMHNQGLFANEIAEELNKNGEYNISIASVFNILKEVSVVDVETVKHSESSE